MVLEERIHRIILNEVNQMVSFFPNMYNVVTTFQKINNSYFNNALKLCKFNLKLKKNYLGYFKYDGYNGNNLINPIISINGAYKYTMEQFESIIAHEMIHYYLAERGIDLKCSHGQEFKQMANDMSAKLGITITETVDTGNMQYSSNNNAYTPSEQFIGKLNAYYQAIKMHNDSLYKDMKSKNGAILSFMQMLYSFDIALLNAIKRCVSKKSINESGELMQAHRNGQSGYNKWRNSMLNALTKKWGKDRQGNGGKSINTASFDKNAPLMSLLFHVFPNKIEKSFDGVNKRTMNMLSSINDVDALMVTIRQLGACVENEINNAQGMNNP